MSTRYLDVIGRDSSGFQNCTTLLQNAGDGLESKQGGVSENMSQDKPDTPVFPERARHGHATVFFLPSTMPLLTGQRRQ